MVELEPALSIKKIDPSQLPAGADVAKVPTRPEEAVSFNLIPLAPEEPTVSTEDTTPPKRETLPRAKETKEEPVIIPVGVPEEFGKGEYLGTIWATSSKEAQAQTLLKFGGEPEDYLLDLIQSGPRPYFVIRKELQSRSQVLTPPLNFPVEGDVAAPSSVSNPEPLEVQDLVKIKCPIDLSEHIVPRTQKFFKCPIDGTEIKVNENII